MADYTQMQLMIHDVPAEQVWPLSVVLADWELSVDWEGPAAQRGTVHLGTLYTEREAAGHAPKALATAVIAAAPGTTFITWSDPGSEWQGVMVRHTPELGRRDDECTADGEAIFREPEINRALLADRGRTALDEALYALVGTRWTAALVGRADDRTLTAAAPAEPPTS
ncbi:hypothetical protein FRP1_28855 (plasmid) [Pseudonocardia sp. EC080625-04]|uniref:DUF3145 family protein n=1 Tax=Pseudonocardia sp. EC080625-04 TaxID=1096868 RepID=UPI0006CB51A5|nr:DUF3145 family protein [Pseudonocardia sp. EC080625-04]ALE76806.1 hypothetical protein FRP1_28855 [Pseudonocardia sp. EC080625-04]